MFLSIRSKYWILLAIASVLAGIILFARLSPVFAYQNSSVAGPMSENAKQIIEKQQNEGVNIFRIDKKALANATLKDKSIDNIKLGLDIPHGLTVEVNHFEPEALVLGKDGKIMALDRFCRLIPYDSRWRDLDRPVLVGLPPGDLFVAPADYRLHQVLGDLEKIRKADPELYAAIAEIDFSDKRNLQLRTTYSHSVFLAQSNRFEDQLYRLAAVGSQEEWDNRHVYDLTYDGQVIRLN